MKERTAAGRVVVINHGQHVKYRLELVGRSEVDFPQEDFKNWQKSIFFMGRDEKKDKCKIKHDATGYFVLFKREYVNGYTVIRKNGDQTYPLTMTWYTLDDSRGIEINAILTKSHNNCPTKTAGDTAKRQRTDCVAAGRSVCREVAPFYVGNPPGHGALDPDDTLFLQTKT